MKGKIERKETLLGKECSLVSKDDMEQCKTKVKERRPHLIKILNRRGEQMGACKIGQRRGRMEGHEK